LQERSLPERSGHLILGNSYFFPSQIGRLTDATVAVHIYVPMAESTRREEWNGDVTIIPTGNEISVSRKRHLGGIKVAVPHDSPKEVQGLNERDDLKRYTCGLNCSI